jgi:hypothetical protein
MHKHEVYDELANIGPSKPIHLGPNKAAWP